MYLVITNPVPNDNTAEVNKITNKENAITLIFFW